MKINEDETYEYNGKIFGMPVIKQPPKPELIREIDDLMNKTISMEQ